MDRTRITLAAALLSLALLAACAPAAQSAPQSSPQSLPAPAPSGAFVPPNPADTLAPAWGEATYVNDTGAGGARFSINFPVYGGDMGGYGRVEWDDNSLNAACASWNEAIENEFGIAADACASPADVPAVYLEQMRSLAAACRRGGRALSGLGDGSFSVTAAEEATVGDRACLRFEGVYTYLDSAEQKTYSCPAVGYAALLQNGAPVYNLVLDASRDGSNAPLLADTALAMFGTLRE